MSTAVLIALACVVAVVVGVGGLCMTRLSGLITQKEGEQP